MCFRGALCAACILVWYANTFFWKSIEYKSRCVSTQQLFFSFQPNQKKTNVKQQKPATEQQLHRRRRTTSSKLITINQQYKFHNFIQLKNSTINTLSHIRNTIGIKVFRFRNGLEAFDKTIRIEDISLHPASREKGSQEWARFRVIFGV